VEVESVKERSQASGVGPRDAWGGLVWGLRTG
jgi:hypothetical protein